MVWGRGTGVGRGAMIRGRGTRVFRRAAGRGSDGATIHATVALGAAGSSQPVPAILHVDPHATAFVRGKSR